MKSRTIGLVLIVIGIIMLAFTGFNFVTREKVVDLGPIQIDKKVNHPVAWSPIVGALLLVGGIVVSVWGNKNRS
jgi:drug/metabolite transporter (DMT)-like permease